MFRQKENGLTREALPKVPAIPSFATIITSIRRCGKSTLLRQLMSQKYTSALYLNFEDVRLANFDTNDFTREYNGLMEAMKSLNLSEGTIVTTGQTDSFEKDGRKIRMIPADRFLLS